MVLLGRAATACGAHRPDEPPAPVEKPRAASDVATVRVALTGPADYRSMIMSDGPVSYWRLGELPEQLQSGDLTAHDEMGVQDGTYATSTVDNTTAPSPFPQLDMPGAIAGDRDGAAYFFESHDTAHPHYQDNFVNIPRNDLQNLQKFTLECWVTMPTNSTPPGRVTCTDACLVMVLADGRDLATHFTQLDATRADERAWLLVHHQGLP